MKKKILALCLVVVLAVTAVTGATLAYFTDTDTDTNVMTMGNVQIRQDEWMRTDDLSELEEYEDQPLFPAVIYDEEGKPTSEWGPNAYVEDTTHQYTVDGLDDTFQMPDTNRMKNVVDKIVTVTNTGSVEAYVRTILLIEDTNKKVMPKLEMSYDSTLTPNFVGYVTINDTQYFVIEFIYANPIAANETTLPSAMAFWMNPDVDDETGVPTEFDIIAYSQGVQTEGFANAEEALDTAFGDVTTANTDWYVTE